MPVIGFNFDKISGERKAPLKKDVKIRTDMNIKEVKKETIDLGEKKRDIARFDFEFMLFYEPKMADVHICGHILYAESEKAIKQIFADWKKDKKIENSLKVKLLNAVLMKCTIKSLLLTQELALPPPIRMPKIVPQTSANNYIG